jgi:putative membrane protein
MWWNDHMGGWGSGWGGAFFWPMHLLGWVFAVAVIVILFRLVSGGRRDRERDRGEDKSVAILRERFARGEIDQREFDERMAVLKK